jgi:hypothetical protein
MDVGWVAASGQRTKRAGEPGCRFAWVLRAVDFERRPGGLALAGGGRAWRAVPVRTRCKIPARQGLLFSKVCDYSGLSQLEETRPPPAASNQAAKLPGHTAANATRHVCRRARSGMVTMRSKPTGPDPGSHGNAVRQEFSGNPRALATPNRGRAKSRTRQANGAWGGRQAIFSQTLNPR